MLNLQDGILAQLIKTSGLKPRTTPDALKPNPIVGLVDTTSYGTGDVTRADARIALLPDTVPVLPEAFNARSNEHALVLDVLLGRSEKLDGKSKMSAHGMGGLGKTTLAASVVRSTEVRAAFAKIGFVSAGQNPAILDVQRTLYSQLVGSNMEVTSSATPASTTSVRIGAPASWVCSHLSPPKLTLRTNLNLQATQLMQLQTGCAGCKYLAVLDDLWEAEHERHLNPFDEAGLATFGPKVLVTTRFAKIFTGG